MYQLKCSVLVLSLAAAPSLGGGHIEVHSYLSDGAVYTFELYTDSTDHWDSRRHENPPFAPGNAMTVAVEFMEDIPLGENMYAWDLSTITLQRMSKEPEHWIYIVHFDSDPGMQPWNGPLPWFEVLVRMNGTIPTPVLTNE